MNAISPLMQQTVQAERPVIEACYAAGMSVGRLARAYRVPVHYMRESLLEWGVRMEPAIERLRARHERMRQFRAAGKQRA